MNARIERDYRDLYRLAIHLQRRVEQNKGEIEMLRLRKGADGAAIVEAYGKVREREDMLWGAVDRVRYPFVVVYGLGVAMCAFWVCLC